MAEDVHIVQYSSLQRANHAHCSINFRRGEPVRPLEIIREADVGFLKFGMFS